MVTPRAWDPSARADVRAVAALLGAYLVATEREKGAAVRDAASLPERYRREADDPVAAFARARVLIAEDARGDPVGCVVVMPAAGATAELKRLWVEPAHRGRGVAAALVDAAIAAATADGVRELRLTVWRWRNDAAALYRRRGFVEAEPWDARPDLLCLVAPLG